MGETQVKGVNVGDGSVGRPDLNIATAGQAVIRQILEVANSGIKIASYTGVDSGTGDVGMVLDWTLLDTRWAVSTWAKNSVKPTYTTSEIPEAATPVNLYFTTARVDANAKVVTAYNYAGVGHLPLAGGNLTGPLGGTSATFSGNVTAPYIEVNAPNNTTHALRAMGIAGAARKIFIAGQTGYSNGFTVEFNGSRMAYGFLNGTSNFGGTINAQGIGLTTSVFTPLIFLSEGDIRSDMEFSFTTLGGIDFQNINALGALFTANVSAPTFTGLASNSTKWDGYSNGFGQAPIGDSLDALVGHHTNGYFYKFTAGASKVHLGLNLVDNTADVNKSVNYAATANISNTLISVDVRDSAMLPSSYTTPSARFEFKSNGAAGLSDGGGYIGAFTLRKYGSTTDWTGGRANQLAFTDNNNLYIRVGDHDTWEGWKKFYHSGNFNKSDVDIAANAGSFSGRISTLGITSTDSIFLTGSGSGSIKIYNYYSGNPSHPGIIITNYLGATTFEHNANGGNTFILGNITAGAFVGNASSASTLKIFPATQLNANTLLGGGSMWFYGQPGAPSNVPVGFVYGSVFQLNSGDGDALALQFANNIEHNSTASTKELHFRSSNNLGWQNDWKKVWHSGNLNPTEFVRYGGNVYTGLNANDLSTGFYLNTIGNGTGNTNWGNCTYGTTIAFNAGYFQAQMHVQANGSLVLRASNAGTWAGWRNVWDHVNLTGTLVSGTIPYWNGSSLENSVLTTAGGAIRWGGASPQGVLTWDTGYATVHSTAGNVLRLGSGTATPVITIDNSATSTFNGRVRLEQGSYTGSLRFGSNDSWHCGISQRDAGNAEMRIWTLGAANGSIYFANNFDGDQESAILPTAGMCLKNNRLGIGNYPSYTFPTHDIEVQGSAYLGSLYVDTELRVNGNIYQQITHGQNHSLELSAADNGAGTGKISLYTWISEPGMTWTGAGIARNMSNTGGFARINLSLTSQMIRFDEGNGIEFKIETSGGTRYTPLSCNGQDVTIGGSLQVNGSGTFNGGGFQSLREIKNIHKDWGGNALNVIAKFKVRDFNYKTRPDYDRTLGFIIDEIPKEIGDYALSGEEKNAVNTYTLHGLSFKGLQEVKTKLDVHETELERQTKEIIKLKARILLLERGLN